MEHKPELVEAFAVLREAIYDNEGETLADLLPIADAVPNAVSDSDSEAMRIQYTQVYTLGVVCWYGLLNQFNVSLATPTD